MRPVEARRKLAKAGFRITRDHKTNEVWSFRDISVALPKGDHSPSQNMIPEVNQALRKAEARKEFEPKPLATLADEFQNAFKSKEVERFYTCSERGCTFKASSPESVSSHTKAVHSKPIAQWTPPAPPPKEEKIVPPPTVQPIQNPYSPSVQAKVPATFKYHFTNEEKQIICDKLKTLIDDYNYEDVAKILNNENFKNPNGRAWTERNITNYVARWEIRKSLRREQRKAEREQEKALAPAPIPLPKEPTPAPKPITNTIKVPASIALVLEDTELTVGQKVAILAAAKVQIPASLQLVLEDPALDDDQKHRIFKMLMGVK